MNNLKDIDLFLVNEAINRINNFIGGEIALNPVSKEAFEQEENKTAVEFIFRLVEAIDSHDSKFNRYSCSHRNCPFRKRKHD